MVINGIVYSGMTPETPTKRIRRNRIISKKHLKTNVLCENKYYFLFNGQLKRVLRLNITKKL